MRKVKRFVKQKVTRVDGMARIRGNLAIKKWQRRDLNLRPKAYESSALPLSYAATKLI